MPGPDPKPYVLFPGLAREALTRYQEVFGGELDLHTYGEFGRSDGPADAIAHGGLAGPVTLFGADAGPDEDAFSSTGLMFALLGTAAPDVLREWFDASRREAGSWTRSPSGRGTRGTGRCATASG